MPHHADSYTHSLSDGHLLLGIAQLELGKKETARLSLLKAKELGDKRADEYLKRIK
jgi:tetratricopeptide repeat family protein